MVLISLSQALSPYVDKPQVCDVLVRPVRRQTNGYLPSHISSLSFDKYQSIMFGERSMCVYDQLAQGCYLKAKRLEVEPTTFQPQLQRRTAVAPPGYTIKTGFIQQVHPSSLTFRIRGVCCHSNETRAPIAYPPKSSQLGSTLHHSIKLYRGSCSRVGMRRGADTHADTQTDHRRPWP